LMCGCMSRRGLVQQSAAPPGQDPQQRTAGH
jgi:hypothetical protein